MNIHAIFHINYISIQKSCLVRHLLKANHILCYENLLSESTSLRRKFSKALSTHVPPHAPPLAQWSSFSFLLPTTSCTVMSTVPPVTYTPCVYKFDRLGLFSTYVISWWLTNLALGLPFLASLLGKWVGTDFSSKEQLNQAWSYILYQQSEKVCHAGWCSNSSLSDLMLYLLQVSFLCTFKILL